MLVINPDEHSETFLIALGNALADEIDEWATVVSISEARYREGMIDLQSDFVYICQYLDAYYPEATGWANRKIKRPMHYDTGLHSQTMAKLSEDC